MAEPGVAMPGRLWSGPQRGNNERKIMSIIPEVVHGIPYGPDILRLDEVFGQRQEDEVITHEEFTSTLRIDAANGRYYAVINAWRRRLKKERNIDTAWERNVGLKILNPADRLRQSECDIQRGIRKTGRGFRRMAIIPRERLDEVGQRRYDHALQVASKLMTATRDANKELAVDLAPVKSLPKPKLINE